MSSIQEIQKSWPTIHEQTPFKAVLSENSNGFVQIVNRNGNSIATCYADGSAGLATLIVAALNFVLTPVVSPEEPKSETPEGVVPT